MDDNFPVLSFQDGLNLYSDQNEGAQSVIEARNHAPLLYNNCISPTENFHENGQDPSPFQCGPIDLLNTPSPKKSYHTVSESGCETLLRHGGVQESSKALGAVNSEPSCTFANSMFEGQNCRQHKGSYDSAVINSQITPTWKARNPRMVMRFSDIRSGLNQATLSSDTKGTEMLQTRPMLKNITKTLFADNEEELQSNLGHNVNNKFVAENTTFPGHNTNAKTLYIAPVSTMQTPNQSSHMDMEYSSSSTPQQLQQWYQQQAVVNDSANVMKLFTSPQNQVHAPTATNSNPSVNGRNYPMQVQQTQQVEANCQPIACSVQMPIRNFGNTQINVPQFSLVNPTCSPLQPPSYVENSQLNCHVVPTSVQDKSRYFMPIPVVQSIEPTRKRKLVFDHVPTQQSTLRERLQYWEKEGSLRKTGNPGLPGFRILRVTKDEPGVVLCDTPPTEDEDSEAEELYGAPKLLRMNPAKVKSENTVTKSFQDDDTNKMAETQTVDNHGIAGHIQNIHAVGSGPYPPLHTSTGSIVFPTHISSYVSGISNGFVNATAPSTPNNNFTYPLHTVVPSFVGLPTPPTTPNLAVQPPLVQVLQFNPGLLHIQSLNVAGNMPGQVLPNNAPVVQQTSPQTSVLNIPIPSANVGMQPVTKFQTGDPNICSTNTIFSPPTTPQNRPIVGPIIAQPLPATLASIAKSENKSTQRPRYFDITKLQIGSFLVTNEDPAAKKKAVMKLMFGKRKMVYEYESARSDQDKSDNIQPVVSIEIGFANIVGLKGIENTLIVEVNVRPVVHYLLKKLDGHLISNTAWCYEQHRLDEKSVEQITSVPYHQLQLKMPMAEKIKSLLCAVDSRFEIIQACPLVLMPSKLLSNSPEPLPSPPTPRSIPKTIKLPPCETQPIHDLRNCVEKCSTSQTSAHQSLQDIVLTNVPLTPTPKKGRSRTRHPGCMCAKGCRTSRCRCVINLQECGAWCACHKKEKCTNILNQLAEANIDVSEARKDECFTANLPRISDVKTVLAQEVVLPCCLKTLYIKDCIPGNFMCPSNSCEKIYYFSWCDSVLYEEGGMLKHHCRDCKKCTAVTSQHCKSCESCHEAIGPDQICPHTVSQKQPSTPHRESIGKHKNYPTPCGPLGSESYGRYVIGSQALGQQIKRIPETNEDIASASGKVGTFEQQKNSVENIQDQTQLVSADERGCPNANYFNNQNYGFQSNANLDLRNAKEANQITVIGQTAKFFTFNRRNMNEQVASKSMDEITNSNSTNKTNEENAKTKCSKPKVSLLAQLLESENEMEMKILPKLLDSDEKDKCTASDPSPVEDNHMSFEPEINTTAKQLNENIPSFADFLPQGDDISDHLIDGVLSCSDADKMLNMMSDLPDNFFNVNTSSDPLDFDGLPMDADDNGVLITNDYIHPVNQPPGCAKEQIYPLQHRDGKSIDIHPHIDGIVEDFPELLSQASDVESPLKSHSLGKILGYPLDTSSPIPN